MNFFKSIKPFQLINAIVDRNSKQKASKQKSTHKPDRPRTPPQSQKPIVAYSKVNSPCYEQAEDFMLSLKRATQEREQAENIVKRKIDLFQRVEIEPHYLSEVDEEKLFRFEFQLGSDIFLERIEHLYQQIAEINSVVKQVLRNRKEDAFNYLETVDSVIHQIQALIITIQTQRQRLKQVKSHSVYRISRIIKKKNVIKEKIRLLKQVKTKNEAALIQISNIDQAFATEQSRAKLYKKINRLTELEKSKYVGTIKSRLISIALGNKRMVEEGLRRWVEGKLADKQIEKLAVMIYFMQKEDIYAQNKIKIDFPKSGRQQLRAGISKIFEWKSFTYVKDLMTKDKIHEFLNYLLKKVE